MPEPINSTVAAVSLVTLAVAMFGPNAGPYVVIILGAVAGGLWALSSAVVPSRIAGVWLMTRCVVTAVVLTALISGLVGPLFGISVTESYTVVAFTIGALGNRWLEILDTVKVRIQSAISGGSP